MTHWLQTSVLPAALAGAVLLLVLWPTKDSGRRLLQRWGLPQPDPEQIREAVRYLRQRRILYVVLFLVFPSVAGAVDGDSRAGISIFVPLLVAMLVAEAVASLRPVSGVRTASLDPRTWRDLVPRWAVRTFGAGAVVTFLLAAAGTSWLALGYVLACLLLVGGLVALAVRRPSVSDEAVDAALRTRTARVAVGIGFGWLGTALTIAYTPFRDRWFPSQNPIGADVFDIAEIAVVVAAIVCWLWVALPSKRSLAAR